MNERDESIARVGKICRDILSLTEADFKAIDELAKQQMEYIHPLKNLKAKMMHRLGKYHVRVVSDLRRLHKFMSENDPR